MPTCKQIGEELKTQIYATQQPLEENDDEPCPQLVPADARPS